MREDILAVGHAHLRRKGVQQFAFQPRIVDNMAMFQRRLQRQLGAGQQHRQLGPGQSLAVGRAARQHISIGQAFAAAVKIAGGLQLLDQADLRGERGAATGLGDRQAQGLEPVILQHQIRHIIGHRHQQRDTPVLVEPPGALGRRQRDLDIDLLVRAIDPGGIVDEIGVDPPGVAAVTLRRQGIFDPPGLRAAQISALADHPRAHFVAIDADGVVGRVADRDIGLAGAFT